MLDVDHSARIANEYLAADRPDEAIAIYEEILAADPTYPEAACNLVSAYRAVARIDDAIAFCRRALSHSPNSVQLHDNLLFTLQLSPRATAVEIYAESRRWNQQHAAPLAGLIQPHRNDRSPDRPLRVGYVSPDFCAHVLAVYLLPLLANHDRSQFEIFCYADVEHSDFVTARLQQLGHRWRNIRPLSDDQTAQLIRADAIDILVDLAMHTSHNRLLAFARKPAPLQVTWMAYPGTTGLATIDYRITDPYLDPPGMFDAYYSETSVRLPHSFWFFDPIARTPVNDLPALHHGYVTFGCLNSFHKVSREALQLWAAVLRAVPSSRLKLLAPQGRSRQWVASVLQEHGVDPSRVDFLGRQPRGQYLEAYHGIDIALDTAPYNGHTTSLDALWMGVPVVTLLGQTVVGRGGYSQLMNLGLADLIAATPEVYVHLATNLATNLPRLHDLRSTLRSRMEASPLMDTAAGTRHVEAAYQTIWQSWCNTAPRRI